MIKRLTRIEYVKELIAVHGRDALIPTHLATLGDLLDLLTEREALHQGPQDQEIFGFDADGKDFDFTRKINDPRGG